MVALTRLEVIMRSCATDKNLSTLPGFSLVSTCTCTHRSSSRFWKPARVNRRKGTKRNAVSFRLVHCVAPGPTENLIFNRRRICAPRLSRENCSSPRAMRNGASPTRHDGKHSSTNSLLSSSSLFTFTIYPSELQDPETSREAITQTTQSIPPRSIDRLAR